MANETNNELLTDNNSQIESLFSDFGRFLYENFSSGAITYHFEPADGSLAVQAKKLIDDIAAGKIPQEEKAADNKETAAEEVTDKIQRDEEDDYGLFETVSRKLAADGAGSDEKRAILLTIFKDSPNKSVQFLHDFIKNSDAVIRRQLLPLLRGLGHPAIVDLYRKFITDEDATLRLQAIMGILRTGSGEGKDVILSAVSDPDANIRRFAVNCLNHFKGEADAAALLELANDPDEMVKRLAIRKLGFIPKHCSFVTLVPKLDDPNVRIRKEAILALHAISGTDLGFNYAAPEEERNKAVRKWKMLARRSSANPHMIEGLRRRAAAMAGERAVAGVKHK